VDARTGQQGARYSRMKFETSVLLEKSDRLL